MEQHPIPQNVSSYQFKLVGDMTLKQFFQVAGGFLVALIFYSSPLMGIIKWPLAIISVLLGVGMAFVPLEERPLENWILAFLKAIYSPTIFNWKRTAQAPKYFQDETPASNIIPTNQTQDAAIKNYLESARNVSGPLSKLEWAEQGFMTMLSGLFAGMRPATPAPATSTPQVTPPPVEKKLEIPKSQPVKITPQFQHLVVEEKVKPVSSEVQIKTQQVNPTIAGEEIVSTREAIFSTEAAPPNPPTTPNVIVGQVVDETRHIIEGVIIEIRDEYGRPIRALRSNKVGHFMAVTPLDNGKYEIISEKEGYQFMPVNFEAKGEIVPPILVEGRKLVITTTQQVTQQAGGFPN